MFKTAARIALAFVLATSVLAKDAPSRAAEKGCAWEKFSDAKLGLAAWVQRCDYGFRKIDFLTQGTSLAIRFSDGGTPDAVIDVIDLHPKESARQALVRFFNAHTDATVARRCVLAPYAGEPRPPKSVKRYTFVPNAEYQKELDRTATDGEIPDPPCGLWGDAPTAFSTSKCTTARGACSSFVRARTRRSSTNRRCVFSRRANSAAARPRQDRRAHFAANGFKVLT